MHAVQLLVMEGETVCVWVLVREWDVVVYSFNDSDIWRGMI